MTEFDCKTLSKSHGSDILNIHVKQENGVFVVEWRKKNSKAEAKPHIFQFPVTFLYQCLNDFFGDGGWHLLGADRTSGRPPVGFGKYIVEQQNYFPKSPQYASAIAGIMFKLNLIDYTEMPTRGNPIKLIKK